MSAGDSKLPSKLGQTPVGSPRTLESRRKLASLFGPYLAHQPGSPVRLPDTESRAGVGEAPGSSATPGRSKGIWSWLSSPVKLTHPGGVSPSPSGASIGGDQPLDGGVGSLNLDGTPITPLASSTYIYNLPDDLLIQVFNHLPSTATQLCTLALVSHRFAYLSTSPSLWASAFNAKTSWTIAQRAQKSVVGVREPPLGEWESMAWIWDREEGPDHLRRPRPQESYIPPDGPWVNDWCYTGETEPLSVESSPTGPSPPSASPPTGIKTPIHYPTLCHSRLALSRHIREPSIDHPTHKATLMKHKDSVYALIIRNEWLISGSRDRSIRIWRLGSIGPEGNVGPTKCLRHVPDAHLGSILSLDLELDGDEGTLVSGSSDHLASIWKVDFAPKDNKRPLVTKITDFRGHQGGILDVVLAQDRVVTASKDTTIRIFDRSALWDCLHVLQLQGPVNGLALDPYGGRRFASAAGDSCWVIWDLNSGEEILRAQNTAVLACVAWKGDWLVTGDSERSVKLWSPSSGKLIRAFSGHTDLVRAVGINEKEGILVSGSYDRSLRMWDIHTGELIRKFAPHHTSQIFDLDVTTTRLASASHDNSIQVLTFGTGLPYLGLFD